MALVYTEEYTAEDFYKHQDISMNLIHKIKRLSNKGGLRGLCRIICFLAKNNRT